MREIEIKVRITSVEAIVAMLRARGDTVSEPLTQHDRVFGLPGVAGGGVGEQGRPWLRIRTETGARKLKHYFTLKKSITGQLDSIEHETEIGDENELKKIIEHLQFTPYSDLTKTRRKAKLGAIELCINHIDGLGDFMEAEILTAEDADYETARSALWATLSALGAQNSDQVTDGYDVLMNKQLGRE